MPLTAGAKIGFEFECLVPGRHTASAKISTRRALIKQGLRTYEQFYQNGDAEYNKYLVTGDSSIATKKMDFLRDPRRLFKRITDVEVVSPILPHGTHVEQFQSVAKAINSIGGFTNVTTGCHWNISYRPEIMAALTILEPLLIYTWRLTGCEKQISSRYGRFGNEWCKPMNNQLTKLLTSMMNIHPELFSKFTIQNMMKINSHHPYKKYVTLNIHRSEHRQRFGVKSHHYYEIRAMGGLGYEKRIKEMDDDINKFHNVVRDTLRLSYMDAFLKDVKNYTLGHFTENGEVTRVAKEYIECFRTTALANKVMEI